MIALFKDIKLTRGYGRSLLQDLTKGNIEFISNEVYDILCEIETYIDLKDCINKNPQEQDELISLSKLNIFNLSSSVHVFPEIIDENYHPFDFQSLTFELSEETGSYLLKNVNFICLLTQNIYVYFKKMDLTFIGRLNEVYREHAHIRFVFCGEINLIRRIEDNIKHIDITYDFFEFDPKNKVEYLETWPTLHNNWMNYRDSMKFNSGFVDKLFIHSDLHISINYFDGLYLERLTNLNSAESFIALKQHKDYIDVTSLAPEKIAVCRDCEMRRMCVDVKLPIRTEYDSKLYFKVEECRYNPYISLWSHEIGYRRLIDCGIINNAEQFLLKKEQIMKINKEIWS